MKKLFAVLSLVFASLCANAASVTVPSTSQVAAQTVLSTVKAGDTVTFTAATYNLTSALAITCGATYNGNGALLTTTTANITLLSMAGCSTPTVVENTKFNGAGALYINGSNSGLSFVHNTVTGLPSNESCTNCQAGVYFDGTMATTLTNTLIEYNTFGDATSCSKVNALTSDQGGYCAGFITHVGAISNFTASYNSFISTEEGGHILSLLGNYVVGATGNYCGGCTFTYNYFKGYHRIALELQMGVLGALTTVQHNVLQDPFNSYYSTLNLSVPCCQWNNIAGTQTVTNPALLVDDNVIISTVGTATSPYGVEFWGTGSVATNNVIQGSICNGFAYGYNEGGMTIANNTIQSKYMAATSAVSPQCGLFILNEEGSNTPTTSGNVTGTTPVAKTSAAPTVVVSTTAVTITTGANETAYYTTDGSTPTVASTPYVAPFKPAAGSTVKVIGQWGIAPLPTSFPAGYGYVPSAVQTVSFVGQPVVVTPPPPVTTSWSIPVGNYTLTVTTSGVTITKQ